MMERQTIHDRARFEGWDADAGDICICDECGEDTNEPHVDMDVYGVICNECWLRRELAAANTRADALAAEVERLIALCTWQSSYKTPPPDRAEVVFSNFRGGQKYVGHYHHGGYAPPWYIVLPPAPDEIPDDAEQNYDEHVRLTDMIDQLQRGNAALRAQLAGETWRSVSETPPDNAHCLVLCQSNTPGQYYRDLKYWNVYRDGTAEWSPTGVDPRVYPVAWWHLWPAPPQE